MNEATSSGDGTGEAGATTPEVSVVIPAHNEAENLATLVPEIAESLADVPHEIVIVDDASTDTTPQVVRSLAAGGLQRGLHVLMMPDRCLHAGIAQAASQCRGAQ